MIAMLQACVVALIKLAPYWAYSRLLHRHLVEYPVARLAKMTRRHVIFAILLIAALLIAQELMAVAGPADMAFAFLWDASIYVDVVGVAVAVTALRWSRTLWTVARGRVMRRPSVKASRSPRVARSCDRLPANDDDVHRATA